MPSARAPLLDDGLAVLRALLPAGYAATPSHLGRRSGGEAWLALSGPAGKTMTCLVLARRRVERRDLGGIAALAARTRGPALLLTPCLSSAVRDRLRGFGLGYWDFRGNAQIALAPIGLRLECAGARAAADDGSARGTRSLCGEMTGRVVRVLVDVRPPLPLAQLAELAHVDASCVSRVVAFLVAARFVERQPRGGITRVRWQELLRRWARDAPLASRGQAFPFLCARGVPDFLQRLSRSGFLHALTGRSACAALAATPPPEAAVLYVDDVDAATAQFGLHPSSGAANVVLVKPMDRSVFSRSVESDGLRRVSPSLAAADVGDGEALAVALRWLTKHEATWRETLSPPEVGQRARGAHGRGQAGNR